MQNVRYDCVLGIKMNKTSSNGMNLLSYGGTLKLVIGWQKKKKAQLPWDANSIAEQLKVGDEWNWSPYSGKSLSLQRQTLAWARLDFLLVVKTGSSHPDGMQNCGHAARLHGHRRFWQVLEQPLSNWLPQIFYSGSQMRDCRQQPARRMHQALEKNKETKMDDRGLAVAVFCAANGC